MTRRRRMIDEHKWPIYLHTMALPNRKNRHVFLLILNFANGLTKIMNSSPNSNNQEKPTRQRLTTRKQAKVELWSTSQMIPLEKRSQSLNFIETHSHRNARHWNVFFLLKFGMLENEALEKERKKASSFVIKWSTLWQPPKWQSARWWSEWPPAVGTMEKSQTVHCRKSKSGLSVKSIYINGDHLKGI